MDAQLCNTVLVWKRNHIYNFQVPEVVPERNYIFFSYKITFLSLFKKM